MMRVTEFFVSRSYRNVMYQSPLAVPPCPPREIILFLAAAAKRQVRRVNINYRWLFRRARCVKLGINRRSRPPREINFSKRLSVRL
jgi:hypothetical protein